MPLALTTPPALVASPVPAATATLSPEAIYLRAVRAMKAEPLPAFVVFDERVRARNVRVECTKDALSLQIRHGDEERAYRVAFRVRDGAAVARDVPQTDAAPCFGTILFPAGAAIAALGAPTASPGPGTPTAAAASPAEPALAEPAPVATPGVAGPALIGAVRVESARYYRIGLVDEEAFEGHGVYRLSLQAYRDPNLHPLTEMLVDRDTFLVRRASGEASMHLLVASGRGAGTVVFDREGAYWVIRDEDFEIAFAALFVHGRSTISVRGSNYSYADALPLVAFPSPSPAPARGNK